MPDKVFLDSNILIYAFSETEPDKRDVARKLWRRPDAWVSTQVLNEVANVLIRKFRLPFADVRKPIDQIVLTLPVFTVNVATIRKALALAEEHPHSFFDALMLATATDLGCTTLYSEDLQHQGIINSVRIINPFLTAAQD